jgi:hypothetical protein
MAERKIIVDHMTIRYSGLFNATELYKLIDFWLMEKGYTKHELEANERVNEDHKEFDILKEPYFKISDYAKYVLRIEIIGKNIIDVDVQKGNHKVRLQQGNITFMVTGYLETDYEDRWQGKPWYYFLRGVFDKVIWRNHTWKYESGLVEHCNHLTSQVRAFFNLYRHTDNI